MRIHRAIILSLFVLFDCTASHGQPSSNENFHIYLLMGQSNMAGRDTRQLATQIDNPRVLALNADGQWVVARDPLHPKQGRTEPGAGPGISFATEMLKADPKITIGLIPCAVGGSPLKAWVKGAEHYEKAVNRTKLAAQTGVITGVLWHQGETDTAKRDTAESYEARLTKMFGDLRQDLGIASLPIVVGQLGDFLTLTPEKYPYADLVRGAIKHLPAVVPHLGYADSAGLGDKGDKLHFNADAAKELGVALCQNHAGLTEEITPRTHDRPLPQLQQNLGHRPLSSLCLRRRCG